MLKDPETKIAKSNSDAKALDTVKDKARAVTADIISSAVAEKSAKKDDSKNSKVGNATVSANSDDDTSATELKTALER